MNSRQVMLLIVLTIVTTSVATTGIAIAEESSIASLPAAVADRVRWIETAKRDNPELFAQVARCYELVFTPRFDILMRSDYHLRGFTIDVLHPSYRSAMQAHPDVYAAIKAAFDRAVRRVDEERKLRPGPISPDIWRDYDAEVRRIFEASGLPDDGTFRLLAGAVRPSEIERLDPATLPAWEAAVLDPNVPWVVKGLVGRLVADFEDLRSTPVLVWFLQNAGRAYQECQAGGPTGPGYLAPEEMKERQGAGPRLDPCQDPLVAGSIVAGEFLQRPRKDIALELAGVLLDIGTEKSVKSWGELLRKSPEWMQLLQELAKNPETATRIQPLFDAVSQDGK
jgi:hypothetical protein